MSLYAGQNREMLRASWREAWQRHEQRLPLAPLQGQMVDVIAAHPEYHALLRDAAWAAESSEAGTNPFLHLGLHLALREQLGTNRPAGISVIHQRLLQQGAAPHAIEHRMIEVLGEVLWQAQSAGSAPDEQRYLEGLRRL